jgi:hypothetical protein
MAAGDDLDEQLAPDGAAGVRQALQLTLLPMLHVGWIVRRQ